VGEEASEGEAELTERQIRTLYEIDQYSDEQGQQLLEEEALGASGRQVFADGQKNTRRNHE